MPSNPLPTNRAALEAIAAELTTAERAVATRIATAEAILLVRRQRIDPRFQVPEAQAHLEREFERLRAKYSDWTWPALPLSGKCLDMPPKDQCHAMQHLDYLRVLYREIVRLQREVATKLAESEPQIEPEAEQSDPHPPPANLRRIVEAADAFLEVARQALATGSSPTELLALIRPLYRSALTLKDALPLDGPDMGMLTRGWPEPVATGRWILARRIDALLDRWGLGDFTRDELVRLAIGGSGPVMDVRSWALPMPVVTAEDVAAVEAAAGSIRRALEEYERGISPPTKAKTDGLVENGSEAERSLAKELRRKNRGTPAALVELMFGRDFAGKQEIAEKVHGDRDASDDAIQANCGRTNKFAETMGLPVRYRCAAGQVFKEP